MSEKPLILVVDDEAPVLELIKKSLSADFEVMHAEHGAQCLEVLQQSRPETILMDVNMPNVTGLDICRKIKSQASTKDIPVIFISALDGIEERLAGYDAGGDDYIVKPFQVSELRRKVHASVSNHEKLLALKENSTSATEAAMQAMTTTGELGVVLGFYRNSFICNDYTELASAINDAMMAYGLKTLTQIVTVDLDVLDFDCSGVVRPLESNLLDKLRHGERIFDFGARTVFNYPYISVLVKNMPLDEKDKYGRYKDNLALLVEGASARIEAINAAVQLEKQKSVLEGLLGEIRCAVQDIQTTHGQHKDASINAIRDLMQQLEECFFSAGLTEEQEQLFMGLVEKSCDNLVAIYEGGLSLDEKFAGVFKRFKGGE